MSLILSIDTSLSGCNLALYDKAAGIKAVSRDDNKYGQSERLIPMINALVADAGKTFADISAIAVTNGPGAFTGMRVGLSTARALAVALNVPVIGFSTLDVLKRQYQDAHGTSQNLIVILDTKRDDYFVGAWRQGTATQPAAALYAENIQAVMSELNGGILLGNAVRKLQGQVAINDTWAAVEGFAEICPLTLAKIADEYIVAEHVAQSYQAINAAPNYLKPADVSVSKQHYKKFEGA